MKRETRGLTLQEGLNAVIIVGLIGLFMGFFAVFNNQFGSQADGYARSTTGENGFLNSSGYTLLAKTNGSAGRSFSIVSARNVTSGALISTGNYTLNSTSGLVKNATVVNWPTVNFTYSYVIPSSSENIANGVNTEFENQTDILGLVLLAVFFGIAITALLASFIVRLTRSRI